MPVQFLFSNSLFSKICLSNWTAKFPIEQLLHLIWVSSSVEMYCCGNEGGRTGGATSCSLSEPGEEAPLEGSGFTGLATIDGVLEFNGA